MTREFCQRCQRVSPVGFHSPAWGAVAGRWSDSILCILCFAALGDEKMIRWEEGMRLYPVSFVTHREFVDAQLAALAETAEGLEE